MKITDIFESVDLNKKKGTYAAAQFDKESRKLVSDYIKDNKIPNPVNIDKLHCTIIYSKAHIPNFKAAGKYAKPIKCTPTGTDVWKTQPDDNGKKANCLVLKLKSPEFVKRHKELMDKYPEATYDYDSFKVHVTISYDIGDMDIGTLSNFTDSLYLEKEYTNPIESGWGKKNSTKTKGSK